MASADHGGFAPLTSAFVGSFAPREGHDQGAFLGTIALLPVMGNREGHAQGGMLPMRVRLPIYLLRGQFAGSTETWIGGSPDTSPPSGHVVTDRSFIVVDS
jgi:hypothetical protein